MTEWKKKKRKALAGEKKPFLEGNCGGGKSEGRTRPRSKVLLDASMNTVSGRGEENR